MTDDRMAFFVSILSKSMRAHYDLTSSSIKEEKGLSAILQNHAGLPYDSW